MQMAINELNFTVQNQQTIMGSEPYGNLSNPSTGAKGRDCDGVSLTLILVNSLEAVKNLRGITTINKANDLLKFELIS